MGYSSIWGEIALKIEGYGGVWDTAQYSGKWPLK